MSRASFSVLLVCTGNLCRSPLAERLLVARLGPGVHVSSAGSEALLGADMTPQIRRAVAERGGDPAGFRARQLSPELVAGADLVLTASRAHRGVVMMMLPRATVRVFTLREFARIAPAVSDRLPVSTVAGRLAAAVPLVACRRGLHPPETPAQDDIPDPYGRDEAAYARCVALTDDAVDRLVAAVAGRPLMAAVP